MLKKTKIRSEWFQEIEGFSAAAPDDAEAWLEDLQIIEDLRREIQKAVDYLRQGNLRYAEGQGYKCMSYQTAFRELTKFNRRDIPALHRAYNADIRGWTYRTLAGEMHPQECIDTLESIIRGLDAVLD